jgi:hypothetical protein
MNADKVGVARLPAHVVVTGATREFKKRCRGQLVIAAGMVGLPRLHLRSSAFLNGKKFLFRCLVEVFWRFARMAEAHIKARGGTCLLVVKLCTHPVVLRA